MAHEIVMPQLSLSMDKGQIVNWLKQTGDKINAGDILLEIESDKATVEVETVESGFLQIVLGPADGEIPVGTVIAYTLAEGESPVIGSPTVLPETKTSVNTEPVRMVTLTTHDHKQQFRRLPSSPAARRKAAELQIDWQQVTGTGHGGRIRERDVVRFTQNQTQPVSVKTHPPVSRSVQLTPLARRIADDFGLDDSSLAALLPTKTRIEREDVEEAIRQIVHERKSLLSAPASPVENTSIKPTVSRREAIGMVRRRIAERMMLSEQTYAPVTLTTEVDATELVSLRETLKNDPATKIAPSYNVLLTKITAKALGEHPILNASMDGSEIVYPPMVNIGIAVDTERGLIVPVVRDASSKSVSDLTQELNDLLGRAAQGKATSDELTGGTFTITNLGPQEIDAFTPIINPPECALLGVGRLRKQMVVFHDQPAVRTMLVLSLTFDHRLVDGGPAARFLQRIKQLVEKPYLWIS
jgi:pyruvate dehydrogenase E2 component (dihydrolipoamide acetyltransferase)